MTENDVLGFDPQDLFKNDSQTDNQSKTNDVIYKMRPSESKDEDGVYRATIKVIYNPFNRKHSFLEQQSYGLNDANGFFSVISSLTLNTEEGKNCPIFKAWKKCHYAEKNSPLWLQQAKVEEGGRALFDKRLARYCLIQILEDKNQPDLVGAFKLWKIPTSIYELIKQKQNPSDPKKAPIPVMDYLFGRSIDIEVYPGPDDKANPTRKTREIKYTGEFSDDVVSCINPDGSPLLTSSEQEILDEYVESMKKVWKSKDPEERAVMVKEILTNDNTAKFRPIYANVLEKIKSWSPNIDMLSYKEWKPEIAERVNKWIEIVLAGNDPRTSSVTPTVANSVGVPSATTGSEDTTMGVDTTKDTMTNDDDLPF